MDEWALFLSAITFKNGPLGVHVVLIPISVKYFGYLFTLGTITKIYFCARPILEVKVTRKKKGILYPE